MKLYPVDPSEIVTFVSDGNRWINARWTDDAHFFPFWFNSRREGLKVKKTRKGYRVKYQNKTLLFPNIEGFRTWRKLVKATQ